MRDHPIHLHASDDGRVHDQFCRGRCCKPPLSPRDARVIHRVTVASTILGLLLLVLMIQRATI